MKKIFLVIGLVSLFTMASLAQDANVFIKKMKDSDSTTLFVQSRPNDKSLFLKVKDGEPIAIIIDGKKYDSDILDILDQDKIATAAVLNGEFAMKKYNEPNVILIITKKEKKKMAQQRNKDKPGLEDAVIVIDGEIVSKDAFKNYSVENIATVSILKDEKSLKKYNTEVGVILVTTKKGNK